MYIHLKNFSHAKRVGKPHGERDCGERLDE